MEEEYYPVPGKLFERWAVAYVTQGIDRSINVACPATALPDFIGQLRKDGSTHIIIADRSYIP